MKERWIALVAVLWPLSHVLLIPRPIPASSTAPRVGLLRADRPDGRFRSPPTPPEITIRRPNDFDCARSSPSVPLRDGGQSTRWSLWGGRWLAF